MQAIRQQYLGVVPSQHSSDRQEHAIGYKEKIVGMRMGEITLGVLQVLEGGYYPKPWERAAEPRALNLALAEMYVQVVSTCKVTAIVAQLGESGVSSTLVSQAAGLLDRTLEAWRNRLLDELASLVLDARYEKG